MARKKRQAPSSVSAARTAKVEAECDQLGHEPGLCRRKGCGKALTGRQAKWCSKSCAGWFTDQHRWTNARRKIKQQGAHYKCAACGSFNKNVEVNHIVPCVGERGWACHHHQENLEILCKPCHLDATNNQREKGLL